MSVVASDKCCLSGATNVNNAKGGNPGGASSFFVSRVNVLFDAEELLRLGMEAAYFFLAFDVGRGYR